MGSSFLALLLCRGFELIDFPTWSLAVGDTMILSTSFDDDLHFLPDLFRGGGHPWRSYPRVVHDSRPPRS